MASEMILDHHYQELNQRNMTKFYLLRMFRYTRFGFTVEESFFFNGEIISV